MKRKQLVYVYLLGDYFVAIVSWSCFFLFRKIVIEDRSIEKVSEIFDDKNFWFGILVIPFFWLLLSLLSGFYQDVYRKSRLTEVWKTFLVTLGGSIILFFAIILDDVILSYTNYYQSFFALFIIHLTLSLIWRHSLTTLGKRRIKKRIVGFNTLIIGSDQNAVDLYEEIESQKKALGYKFIGFIEVNGNGPNNLNNNLSKLGRLKDLNDIIEQEQIEEVILAIETSEHDKINEIMNRLSSEKVIIKIIPEIYDIMLGSVSVNDVWGAVLIEIFPDLMPSWQRIFKRIFDTMVSILVILILSPLLILIAIKVKLSSPGPVIYKQERVGMHGKPFEIWKFRSMYIDAEDNGPQLSTDNDDRITKFGKVLRKWRMDELPQFINVLNGEMSLVGPRPERQFYIDKIIAKAPHYTHLHKVKPGITSLGQVKFGYASNVNEMIQRMKFDILYIENMSLALDFKVLFYTVVTILQGTGR